MSENKSVLARILAHKRVEVDRQKDEVSLESLKARCASAPPVRSFAAALRRSDTVALIAEVKKASPSKGVFVANFDHLAIARTYAQSGAAALSVLTDVGFFQGNLTFLAAIRALPEIEQIPLLRKDFIIDPYQVYEARAYGADALLLIVSALDDDTLRSLLQLTHELGMQALVEVHDEEEAQRALQLGANIIGVNNRDLRTFVTSLDVTERIAKVLPSGSERPIFVSESGIFSAADVARVRASGVDAVLVGESLITAPNMAEKVREIASVSR